MSIKFGTMSFQNSIVLFYIQNKRRPSTSACSLPIYNFLRLLLDVCEVPVQRPGGQQIIIQHPVMLPQKGAPPLSVNADRPFFFGR